jgi:hypothetical protein
MTQGVSTLVEQHNLPVAEYLCRHQSGDWGDLDHDDKQANGQALHDGTRIFSAYHFQPSADLKIKLWVITEADRSSTTILLPEEY